MVYVGSEDNKTYALYASNGTERWNRTTGGPVYSSPAVVNGIVYIGSDDGNVYAYDADDGATVWTRSTGDPVNSVLW